MELTTYRGHIRNHEALCRELGIGEGLSREEREREIILRGYEKWGTFLPDHLYGMFAFAIEDGQKTVCFRVERLKAGASAITMPKSLEASPPYTKRPCLLVV